MSELSDSYYHIELYKNLQKEDNNINLSSSRRIQPGWTFKIFWRLMEMSADGHVRLPGSIEKEIPVYTS